MINLRLLLFTALLVLGLTSCSPAQPSTATITLTAIRYVRTRPVTASAQLVELISNIPIIGDPEGRSQIGTVSLRSVDGTTFVYDNPEIFGLPVDTECTFLVEDQAVSPFEIATDIYVNSTRIRVEIAGNNEIGHFKVGADGHVY